MKHESEPIAGDEWLLRLVWEDRITRRVPTISPNAFVPRDGKHPDVDGLSLYRQACLADPADALTVIAPDKRGRYAVVAISVAALAPRGLTVRPSPVPELPGHVVIPELNTGDYQADKARFAATLLSLAEEASAHILHCPAAPPPT